MFVSVDDTSTGARFGNTRVVDVPAEPPELTPRLAALLLRVVRKATAEGSLDEPPTADANEALRS